MDKPKNYDVKLLKDIDALKNPNYHELNQHCARNDRLLHTVLCAYVKHHIGNDDIGWDELSNILYHAVCNSIDDGEFCKWLERLENDEIKCS